MTNTTYYKLNIVEGNDVVNPLIVDNPNYEKIDEVMHDNAISGVTLATELANATVHALTRENSECAVIRFIATSIWKEGDTITVDGVPVTALLPSGETLPDGAYVINSNVLCILTGTNLTVYAERKKLDDATEISYNDTNVSMELDRINDNINVITNRFGVANADISSNNIAYVLYPSGFNYNNCIVLSCEIVFSTNESYYSYNAKSVFEYVQKNSTGVNVAVLNNEFIGKSVKVVFFKLI